MMSLQEQRIGHMANEEIKMMNQTKGDENSKCVNGSLYIPIQYGDVPLRFVTEQ